MASTYSKTTDGIITLSIAIPLADVQKAREAVIEETVKTANVTGFRKGKVPRKLVEEKIDESKVKEEVLRKLLPKVYIETVQEHKLNPIINPQIHVSKLENGKDWEFTATTCEAPAIDLNNYKANVQKVTAKSKIIVPGKEKQEPRFEEIIKALLEGVKITIPKILIDQEVDKLLAQMLDEVKRLGLTLDQYLSATKKTPDTLRAEYAQKAETDIKLEFTLQKIAEEERIAVTDQEIEEALQKAKDDNERKNLEANRYLLASILRQQKTLDFLKNL